MMLQQRSAILSARVAQLSLQEATQLSPDQLKPGGCIKGLESQMTVPASAIPTFSTSLIKVEVCGRTFSHCSVSSRAVCVAVQYSSLFCSQFKHTP